MIAVKVTGDKAAAEMLKGVQARAVKGTPFFQRAALLMFKDVMEHFAREQGPKGKWAPWTPATALARKKGRGGNKILQDTGTLKGRTQFRGLKDNAEVYVNLSYAMQHQRGDPAKNLPARPYMWLSDKRLKVIGKEYGRFVAEGKR